MEAMGTHIVTGAFSFAGKAELERRYEPVEV